MTSIQTLQTMLSTRKLFKITKLHCKLLKETNCQFMDEFDKRNLTYR